MLLWKLLDFGSILVTDTATFSNAYTNLFLVDERIQNFLTLIDGIRPRCIHRWSGCFYHMSLMTTFLLLNLQFNVQGLQKLFSFLSLDGALVIHGDYWNFVSPTRPQLKNHVKICQSMLDIIMMQDLRKNRFFRNFGQTWIRFYGDQKWFETDSGRERSEAVRKT